MKRSRWFGMSLVALNLFLAQGLLAEASNDSWNELFCFSPKNSVLCEKKVEELIPPMLECLKDIQVSDNHLLIYDSDKHVGHPGERCLTVQYINSSSNGQNLQSILENCGEPAIKQTVLDWCNPTLPKAGIPSVDKFPEPTTPNNPNPVTPVLPEPVTPTTEAEGADHDPMPAQAESDSGDSKIVAAPSPKEPLAASNGGGCSQIPATGGAADQIFSWILLLGLPALACRKR
ncbi:MAG: hypothetical protein K8R69_03740 [Deltaproteobacteria bacterium]|nr:hypothetical protein [Deltaproteobacteria bacterium]